MFVIELVGRQGKIMTTNKIDTKDESVLLKAIRNQTMRVNGRPYIRTWVSDGYTYVDYGSHSMFYRFKKL